MLSFAEFANAVSALSISLAGFLTTLLVLFSPRHQEHWLVPNIMAIFTGLSSAYYHFSHQSFIGLILDNLFIILLLISLEHAFLRDYKKKYYPLIIGQLIAISLFFPCLFIGGPDLANQRLILDFRCSDLFGIANGFVALWVIFLDWPNFSNSTKFFAIFGAFAAIFGGFFLNFPNETISLGFFVYHSAWHIVMALLIFYLWAFNQLRYEEETLKKLKEGLLTLDRKAVHIIRE